MSGDATPRSRRPPRASASRPQTLRRWADDGVVPRARERRLDRRRGRARARSSRGCASAATRSSEIREATRDGRLAFGYIEDLLPPPRRGATRSSEAARGDRARAGADRAHLRARWASPPARWSSISEDDLQLLRYVAAVLAAGFPLVAFLQLVRVYGQALAQIADAEVRLFHLYVHEPLMRDGVPGVEMAEEMEGLRASCCRSPRRSWTTSTSASSRTSSSRT